MIRTAGVMMTASPKSRVPTSSAPSHLAGQLTMPASRAMTSTGLTIRIVMRMMSSGRNRRLHPGCSSRQMASLLNGRPIHVDSNQSAMS